MPLAAPVTMAILSFSPVSIMLSILDNNARWLVLLVLLLCAGMAWPIQTASAEDQFSVATSYLARGLLPEAEHAARLLLHQQTDLGKAHFLLGYILFRRGKPRESLAEYTEGAKYQTPSAADLRAVGADYVLLAAYADADKWFTKATEFEPQNSLGWYYLGRTKYNENRFEEAVAAFKKCLALAPRHVRAEDNLALSLQALGRNEEALEAFRTAVAWQAEAPDKNPWPHIDLGRFFLETNQPLQAIGQLRHAIELAPNSPEAHRELGKAYVTSKDLVGAQAELETAIRLEPDNAQAHYVLGQLYQKQKEAAKAQQEFTRYAQLRAAHQGIGDDANRDFPASGPK